MTDDVLPEVRRVDLDEGQAVLPPRFKVSGVSLAGRVLMTITLPTGTAEPTWRVVRGLVRLHDPASFVPSRDLLVSVAAGFQVLIDEVPDLDELWQKAEWSAYQAFYYYPPQLHAIMLKLREFRQRVISQDIGTTVEEVWEFADPADYYEFGALLTNAACVRLHKLFVRDNVLAAFYYWWEVQYAQYRDEDSPQARQVLDEWERQRAVITEVRGARPSFP